MYKTYPDQKSGRVQLFFGIGQIGTPFCVTVDFDTLEDDTVTVQDGDTAVQECVSVNQLSVTKRN